MFLYKIKDNMDDTLNEDFGLPLHAVCPICRGVLTRQVSMEGVVLNNVYAFPAMIPSYRCDSCRYKTYEFNELGIFPKEYNFGGKLRDFPLTTDELTSEW